MSHAGSFLIARPTLKDPNFAQTVVLLLAHSSEGAFGVVLNRPIEAEDLPFPLFDGGPCPSPGVVILHGQADWVEAPDDAEEAPAKPEVAPGIFVGDETCLSRAAHPIPGQEPRCRVFRGFAGWGSGQLEQELASGAWALTAATGQLLFDTPIEDLWVGLVPPAFPQPSLN
jgi:putative transcriptional regulator